MSRKPLWIQRLERTVIERDEAACINCGRPAQDSPHHIVPRSRGKKWSPWIWHEANMCCLCRSCHNDGQTVWMRAKLIEKMVELYGYDMEWIREFGIVLNEAA